MVYTDIGSAEYAEQASAQDDYSVQSETTDASQGTEFRYNITDWNENLGYYKNIPELQVAIDAKANWTMGAGWESDVPEHEFRLAGVTGNGNDTFNTILSNMIRTYTIAGDSFAEIIRNEGDKLINIKPLDPSSMVIVSTKYGIISHYEQVNKITREVTKRFETDEILHLSRLRIADEIHGLSIIPSVKWIIDARNEAMEDWKRVMHMNVAPKFIYHLDTDDTGKIATFKAKMDKANAEGENIYVPKGAVVPELMSVATNASLNPLAWINQLNDYFFQAVNVPQIVIGNSKEFTDASGKIVYLAYEQSVKGEQLYVEEQMDLQLGISINLTFPASMQNEMISDQPNMELEEEPMEQAAQPNDMTTEMEGKT